MVNGQKENRWKSLLRHPKLLGLAAACPFAVYVAAFELNTSVSERSPTYFQAERFADKYRDQRWLCVEGRLAAEYAWVKENKHDLVDVHVPVVPLDWKPDQVVHIVSSFSMRNSEVDSWIEKTLRSPEGTLTGLVGPLGSTPSTDMYPKLRFEEPIVVINAGRRPSEPISGFLFLACAIIAMVATWWWLLATVCGLKRW